MSRLDVMPPAPNARPFRLGYRAKSRNDVAELVTGMRSLADEDKLLGLTAVFFGGLMLPSGILRVVFWFAGLRGRHFKGRVISEFYRRDRRATVQLWEQTCDHVLDGRDLEDADSVGGWSQREIDLFIEMMSRVDLVATHSDNPVASAVPSVEGGQG